MQLECKVADVLRVEEDGFICFTGKDYLKVIRNGQQDKGSKILNAIINGLGQRSAKAQQLKAVITNTVKFYHTPHRIYIKVKDNKALGFVKVGQKNLFFHDHMGKIRQLAPTAVLDIYVHESCQRTGIGKEIFEKFLHKEGKNAQKLAYDRPSDKLLAFLRKHYKLAGYIPQNNNFVVYNQYFQNNPNRPIKGSSSSVKAKDQPQVKGKQMSLGKKEEAKEQNLGGTSFQPGASFKNIKDQSRSSFGCPWAVEEKIGFRTTSRAYGNHYRH